MRIKSISPKRIKYNVRKSSFKVNVKGANLRNSSAPTACTLGFHDAIKVWTSRRGKNAVCVFNMSDFSQTGYYPLTISIEGVGEVTRENAVRIR